MALSLDLKMSVVAASGWLRTNRRLNATYRTALGLMASTFMSN